MMIRFTSLRTLGYSIIFSPEQHGKSKRRYISIELNESPSDNIYNELYSLYQLSYDIGEAIQEDRKIFINTANISLDDDRLLLPFSDEELIEIQIRMYINKVSPSSLKLPYYDKKNPFYLPHNSHQMARSELSKLLLYSEN